ncbi:hypothetical protein GCM10027164_10970 [Algoriphagus taiwanensis]
MIDILNMIFTKFYKIQTPMKKLSFIPALALTALLFLQANPKPEADNLISLHPEAPALPADVKAIVQQKCYGCHNAESKNEKGKAKLDWDALEAAKKSKALATMGKITEELEEGAMPPTRFLENNPDKKLTEEETATLLAWSKGKKK